jgi:hypothetical protein
MKKEMKEVLGLQFPEKKNDGMGGRNDGRVEQRRGNGFTTISLIKMKRNQR